MTYADIAVFHVTSAVEAQFPEAWASNDVPLLKAFKQRIAEFGPIKEYLASDRVRP